MRVSRVAPFALLMCGCVPQSVEAEPVRSPAETVVAAPAPEVEQKLPPIPGPPLAPAELEGEYEQGGYIRGIAPFDSQTATFNGEPFEFDTDDRGFFIGLDRDAGSEVELIFTARDGQTRTHRIAIKPRDWQIERVNVPRRPSGSSEAWWKRREPEWLAIQEARAKETGAQGWRQQFIWPVTGRISGRFGRQRIYQGEPGSYHSGLDIAPGHGARFVAPADGVVVLARTGFSLEGGIVIVDHGAGLNSAFIHLSEHAVQEGDQVSQGQYIGNVGATGRATGPHLHWSIKWRDARLDPLLFVGPMS